jgi:hypothetical protein
MAFGVGGNPFHESRRETGISPSANMYLAKGEQCINMPTAQMLRAAPHVVLFPREMIEVRDEDGA